MQVRYDEGVANHIGLEPCADAREGGGEASVEEHTGQPLSLVKILIPGADAVANAEGNTCGRVKASVHTARRGRRTWHVWKLVVREGDPKSNQAQQTALVRIGKARSRSR